MRVVVAANMELQLASTPAPLSKSEALPPELRLVILRNLDARALARVSLSCTALRAAASDDSLWRTFCAELYPRGANVGTALAPKHRDCVLRANGWAQIPRMPRELISFAASGRASRSSAVPRASPRLTRTTTC